MPTDKVMNADERATLIKNGEAMILLDHPCFGIDVWIIDPDLVIGGMAERKLATAQGYFSVGDALKAHAQEARAEVLREIVEALHVRAATLQAMKADVSSGDGLYDVQWHLVNELNIQANGIEALIEEM